MIYLKRNNLLIRELCEADIEPIVAGEIAQGWLGASREKYDMRLRDVLRFAQSFRGGPWVMSTCILGRIRRTRRRLGPKSSTSACLKFTEIGGSARR